MRIMRTSNWRNLRNHFSSRICLMRMKSRKNDLTSTDLFMKWNKIKLFYIVIKIRV